MNDKLNIEELFKSKLEGLTSEPSPKVWKQTSRALRRDAFTRFNLRRFNIYHIVGLILVGSIITVGVSDKEVIGVKEEALGVRDQALGGSSEAAEKTKSSSPSARLGDRDVVDEDASTPLGLEKRKELKENSIEKLEST
jgi:hypothetical protein